jgi:NifU-like protein involved in Fe-S cluster formation
VDYSDLVRQHFDAPSGVGPLVPAPARVFRGEAGSVEQGGRVSFEADIAGRSVRRLAFRAYGCPHLIAACDRVTGMLTGAPVEALLAVDASALATELDAPAVKLGRLLLVEDALRNCFRDWDTTQPAAAR